MNTSYTGTKNIDITARKQESYECSIISRLQAGDSSVIDEVVDQYKNQLFGFIVRMVNDYDIAEDVFQETWIKVIRNIHSFRGDAKFSTWLFQIARNVYRDALRKRRGIHYLSLDDIDELISESEATLIKNDEIEQAQMIITALPGKMKETVVLRYYHDLSIKEIADVLGCSEGTVKSRLFRGIRLIREKRKLLNT